MAPEELNARLSRIPTAWAVLQTAHSGADAAEAARSLLVERYGGAARRYLLRLVGDPEAADDLAQEFALCLVRGDFRGADPGRGRFRDYVKSALFHLVGRYRRRQARHPGTLEGDVPESTPAPPDVVDRQFLESWRDALLGRAWAALRDAHPKLHDVLRRRAEHPEMSSEQAAQQCRDSHGARFTPAAFRQALRRARLEFAGLLFDEVARSIREPTVERVEEELRDLGLLAYCGALLDRRRARDG